jgi:hypothetical protein
MVIESVADNMQIKCTRADNVSTTSEPILSKICTQISQAYYIIVDITDLNPNVFYELGIAHVLRDANKVLIIKEEHTQCPSDIRHLHYYAYSKSNLKHLKETIAKFFSENNILGDLHDILSFLDLLPRDNYLSQNFVVSLSDCVGNAVDSLILILNNRVTESLQPQAINLLTALTNELNRMPISDGMYSLYSNLILFVLSKTYNAIDIFDYIRKIFSGDYGNLTAEWIADCSITILDDTAYFDIAISWILDYLKQSSPAAFDMARYKIEIGIIKSKSALIDSVLVNGLTSDNKTLAEHCAKLIKERKTHTAIPNLVNLIENDDNPYVIRNCIDALVTMAPLTILLEVQKILDKRKALIESNPFINKHLGDLTDQICALQNASNF